MGYLCFSGEGCLGCSMCESEYEETVPAPHVKDGYQARQEEKLRSRGFPTLRVSFADFLKKS